MPKPASTQNPHITQSAQAHDLLEKLRKPQSEIPGFSVAPPGA